MSRSGLDTSHIDPTFRPQDDLFRFFNGQWLARHEIPADRASDGIFYALRDDSEAKVREIIENDGGKVGALYDSFMDEAAIEARGITPLAEDLALVSQISDQRSFIATLARLEIKGVGGLFASFIYSDAMDSDTNILYLSQGGLSLPDEAYYREAEYEPIRQAFLEHVAKMFSLVDIEDGRQKAERILALETEIAKNHWDQVKNRDATLTYNKYSRQELEKLAPGFLFALYLSEGQIPESAFESVIVQQPDFFSGVSAMLEKFDAQSWKDWLSWQVISGAAPYLTEAIVQQNFSFYGTTLSGTPQIRERWKRGVALVEGAMGEAVGQIYVEKHFPPSAKAAMDELIANLIRAYRHSITHLDWMSEETKQRALEKLEKFTPKIGYPSKWRDYSSLEIKADDLIGNLARISAFQRAYELAKLGKPVDRSEWLMTPQTVNAYYNPVWNEIVFPAAILQPPFFNAEADLAANYGAIGAVIGHEIGHGFDDQGSKFDGYGNMVDWWSESDRAEFEKRAQALIEQYDQLTPEELPDVTVNGALTVGENIGDLGGLSIAYKAYLLALDGTEPEIIDELTGAQRFFLSWSQAWRGKVRPEELRRRIATDPHSPAEFRCNQIVANLEEFYEAFGVSEGDRLWREPAARVRIW